MFVSAMDLGWKRAHHLVMILIFLKHAVAREGRFSQNVQPQQNWPVHKHFFLKGIQSSVLEAPVTRSIPVGEVAPNTVPGKSLNASKSRFSLSSQYVKGGFFSSYKPMSHTQSAPSILDGTSSLLKLLGSSSPSAQNVDRQDSYSWSSQDGSGLQGVSAKLASTPVRGGSSGALSVLSQSSSSQSTPDSLSNLNFSPFDVSGLPTSYQSSSNTFTASSQDRSGLQLGGASSPLAIQSSSSTGSSGSSRRLFPATYQGSSGPQLAKGSSQLVYTSGLFTQPPSAERQSTSGSPYAKLAASPLGFSQATSGLSSYSQYTSSSQSRVGTQLAASNQYVPGQGSGYGSSVQPQGTTSQYTPAFSLGAKKMSSQYYQATRSGSLSPSQSSQGWKPSITKTQGFQASSNAVSQGSGTSQSSIWSPSRFSSLQSQSTFSQNTPAPLGAKGPVYSQAAPSGSSLSLSQPSQLRPPASRSQSFQTSSTVASLSSSPSQGFKDPSRRSTSAVSPGQLVSMQEGSARYSGLSSLSQGTSSQYSPASSGYTKLAASPLGVSQSTSGHGSYSQYTSSSQSRAGTQLAGFSHHVPVHTGSTFTDGSSLHLQGTSNQYVPAALGAKVPVYSQTAPSGSLPSQLQPSTRWSQGFQTSGTVASTSSSPSQGSKVLSRFSNSAVRPGQLPSTQKESGGYGGLFGLSQSASALSSPGSPAYAKRGSSLLDISSQSTSGQSSYSQNTLSSQSRAGTQLAGSSPYVPVQSVSSFTDGSSLLQGTSTQYLPTPLDANVPSGSLSLSQPSRWQPSSGWSKGFQTSGTVASQSNSLSQGSKTPNKFSALTSAVSSGQFISTQGRSDGYSGLSSLSQSTSSQYVSGSPTYAKRGSSLQFSSQSTSDPSSSGLYASSSQNMAGTQLVGSSSYVPARTGSTFTGASLQSQTSNQYAPFWIQWSQASGTAVPQSSFSPQSAPPSSVSSFLPALSPSVDSMAQNSVSSSWRNSDFGTELGPSKLSAQAAPGSAVSQISPGLSVSVHHPSGSMTSSLGSSVQGALQGTFSGQSSDSTLPISSSYGSTYVQKASDFSRHSQSSSATGQYSSSVKG